MLGLLRVVTGRLFSGRVLTYFPWHHDAFVVAMRNGRLDTLIWMVANGITWNPLDTEQAALGGHLHILQWM